MIKALFILVVFSTASITAVSQVCFLGGGGSGAATNLILYCSNTTRYTSSEKGSGFSATGIYYCADITRFTSSEKGSGQDSSSVLYCNLNNQGYIFHSSQTASGSNMYGKISYCTNGHFSGGSSAQGYNKIAYCSTVTFNGSSGSGYSNAVNFCLNPLPVELLSFQALKNNDQALLLWSTGTEINNDFFLIERSTDGQNFSRIGTRHGAGNSNSITYYNFTDSTPTSGTNYYRLRQVDFDGSENFSEVRVLDFGEAEKKGDIFIFPNPVTQGENINIFIPQNTNTFIYIFDLKGSMVFSDKIDNETILQIDASTFNSGMYFIRLENNQQIQEGKLIIQ